MENSNIHETIDLYLDNLLSDEERLDFEQKLASDKQLQQLLEEAKLTNEVVHFANLAILRDQIGQDIKKIKYKDDSKFNPKTLGLLVSGLMVVGGVTTYYFQQPKNSTQETKTTQSEKPVENSIPTVVEKKEISTSKTTETPKKENVEPKIETSVADHKTKETTSVPQVLVATPTEKTNENKTTTNKTVDDSKSVDLTPKATTPANTAVVTCTETFDLKTSPSCKSKSTGEVLISSPTKIDFTASVNSNDAEKLAYNQFGNLEAGNYDIIISYNKECAYKKSFSISEKWCALNTSFSFNPDFGEKWELQYEALSEGTYTIYSKQGVEIYSDSFGNGNEYWNGTDKMGNIVPVGTYIARINYKNGQKETVELTIIR